MLMDAATTTFQFQKLGRSTILVLESFPRDSLQEYARWRMDDVVVGIEEESTRDDDEALTKFSKHHHYETSSSLWRKQRQATN